MSVYKDKKVLVTGCTGFKGSWLCIWLLRLGANVAGYALSPERPVDNYVLSGLDKKIDAVYADIRDYDSLKKVFAEKKPDFVFHLAAQPIVTASYLEPRYNHEVNIMGTVNVLECVRQCSYPVSCVIVSSDKCYKNTGSIYGYRENDQLGGADPYSASKSCVELITDSYRRSFFNGSGKNVATARAGNVIGGGDWGTDRLAPDCVRGLEKNGYAAIRNPSYRRPWQHVLEPLKGYLELAWRMGQAGGEAYAGAWNFGPDYDNVITVKDLAEKIIRRWGSGSLRYSRPAGEVCEAEYLNLDSVKARRYLGWSPRWDIDTAVDKTVEWYKSYKTGDVFRLCERQIEEYEDAGKICTDGE